MRRNEFSPAGMPFRYPGGAELVCGAVNFKAGQRADSLINRHFSGSTFQIIV